jgi:hypothetical protein
MTMAKKAKKAAAGWYGSPVKAPTEERFWDGQAWTDQRRSLNRPCPYCTLDIARKASRCPHCAGELRWCARCGEHVAMTSKQKFVGVLRGGMKTQYRCAKCGTVLDGPRF